MSILQTLESPLPPGHQAPDVAGVAICLASVTIVHTLPVLLLTVIYAKIFTAAHNSSERARRNSAVRKGDHDH